MKSLLLSTAIALAFTSSAFANPATATGPGAAAATTGAMAAGSASKSSAHINFDPTINLTPTSTTPQINVTMPQQPASNVTINNPAGQASGSAATTAASDPPARTWAQANPYPVSPAIAPSISNYGGCPGRGLSAAITLPGGSGSGGFSSLDPVCQASVFAHDQEWARAILCAKDDTARHAALYTRHPCPQDVWEAEQKRREEQQEALQPHRGFFEALFGTDPKPQVQRVTESYPVESPYPKWCYYRNAYGGLAIHNQYATCRPR